MRVIVKLIIKVLVNSEIKLFAENNILPEFEILKNRDISAQIVEFVKKEYNFLPTVCFPKLVSATVNDDLFLYYDFYYPKDYIDEENVIKIVNIGNGFNNEDATEIRQSVQIPPYQYV